MFLISTCLAVFLAAPSRAAEPVSDAGFALMINRIPLEINLQQNPFRAEKNELISHEEAFSKVWKMLAGSSVPQDFVRTAFDSPLTRVLPDVIELLNARSAPPEPYEEYRKRFITPRRIQAGVEFYKDHAALLLKVGVKYGVDEGLVCSFAGIETNYGAFAGKTSVFNALYTAIRNVPPLNPEHPNEDRMKRSAWAANELAEFLKFIWERKTEAHALEGSWAGAFGFGQFMPSSFNQYAVDFDGDGRRDYDQWPDVLGSIANYEVAKGYQSGGDFSPGSKNWNAIFAYNNSENYVKVILELRRQILANSPSVFAIEHSGE